MRTRSFAIAVLLLVSSVASAAYDPAAKERIRDVETRTGSHPDSAAAHADAEASRLFGRFTLEGEVSRGRWVRFSFQDDGRLVDFAYPNGTAWDVLFEEVWVANFRRDDAIVGGGARAVGSTFRLLGDDVLLRVANQPTAALRVHNGAELRVVTFLLPDGVAAGPIEHENRTLRLDWPGYGGTSHGHLAVTAGAIEVAERFVSATLPARASLSFMAHPRDAGPEEANLLHDVQVALARRAYGGEAAVVVANGTPLAASDEFGVAFDVAGADPRRLTVNLTADAGGGPKVVLLRFDRRTVPALTVGGARVLLDGTAVPLVATTAPVVAATSEAVANVSAGGGLVFVLANVPTFSVRSLTVEEGERAVEGPREDADTPGFAILGVASVLALVAALRRRQA